MTKLRNVSNGDEGHTEEVVSFSAQHLMAMLRNPNLKQTLEEENLPDVDAAITAAVDVVRNKDLTIELRTDAEARGRTLDSKLFLICEQIDGLTGGKLSTTPAIKALRQEMEKRIDILFRAAHEKRRRVEPDVEILATIFARDDVTNGEKWQKRRLLAKEIIKTEGRAANGEMIELAESTLRTEPKAAEPEKLKPETVEPEVAEFRVATNLSAESQETPNTSSDAESGSLETVANEPKRSRRRPPKALKDRSSARKSGKRRVKDQPRVSGDESANTSLKEDETPKKEEPPKKKEEVFPAEVGNGARGISTLGDVRAKLGQRVEVRVTESNSEVLLKLGLLDQASVKAMIESGGIVKCWITRIKGSSQIVVTNPNVTPDNKRAPYWPLSSNYDVSVFFGIFPGTLT